MARRPRADSPDTWHHVMNRGIGRRTIFERTMDFRRFLALVAREVRAKRIEVHAFCLMPTHFHMLVRSPRGELSSAMRRLQNGYARWFNRSRWRDGPLFKGRFLSRAIDSLDYRRNVVIYIHDNPVEAQIVKAPEAYEWSSAALLARARRPPWLSTGWIEEEIARRAPHHASVADGLAEAFPSRVEKDFRTWVEKQLHTRLAAELHESPLAYAGSPGVVRWMFRRAHLADGTTPFHPVSPAGEVERVVARAKLRLGPKLRRLIARSRRHAKDAWVAVRAGLLRLLSGCSLREIAHRTGRHVSTACRDVRAHLTLQKADAAYARLVAQLTSGVLALLRAG